MLFLNPAILWALGALSIPIIIHLFHFRRFKKVYFTNMRFLEEVKEQTKNRTRLRNLLVLLSRMLAFAFLVFAFAQPTIPTREGVATEDQAISIFVDNSFSMDARGQDVPLLDEAKKIAIEMLASFPETYEFQILTHDFEGRHQRLYSKEEAMALVEDVNITSEVHMLSEVIERQKLALVQSEKGSREIFLISDFQKSITDLEQYADTSLRLSLVPIRAVNTANLSIDSVWFDQPVQIPGVSAQLYVQVRNASDRIREDVRLTLRYDGQTRPIGTLDVPANGTSIDTVVINPGVSGWQSAEVLIEDYPVQFDDAFHLTFNVADQLNILIIHNGSNEPIYEAVFSGSEFTNVTQEDVRNLNYADFPAENLIVLHELPAISSGLATELFKYIESGGNVMIFPARDADLSSYNGFLSQCRASTLQEWLDIPVPISQINSEEFIFSNVYERIRDNITLPELQGYFRLRRTANSLEEPLLRARNGSTYIGKYKSGSGHLYLSSAPLATEYSNLITNGEIFVPMLHKMALATTQLYRIAYTIGSSTGILTKASSNKDPIYQVSGPNEFIPSTYRTGNQMLLQFEDQIKESGVYTLTNQDTLIARLAFNYDRLESDLTCYTSGELKDIMPDGVDVIEQAQRVEMASLLGEQRQGRQLWRWCIIFVLVFLLCEQLLLKYLKT